MKTILIAILGLALSCPALASEDRVLDKATQGLFCYQEVSAPETEFKGVYIDSVSRKLFGEVDRTILITEDDKLVAVALDLGVEAPKYKQSHHLYKYLVRKYGEPLDGGYALLWFTETGLTLAMGAGSQPQSIVFAVYCN